MSALAAPASAVREQLAIEHALALQRGRASMLGYVKHVTPTFSVNWHHRVLCNTIDRMVRGELKRVIISAPPRHGKTEVVSRHLPGYLFGLAPDDSIIACSYGAELAQRNNRDSQRIIDSEAYRELFPGTRLFSANVRTVAQGSYLRNSDIYEIVGRRGQYRCAGVGGPITGSGGKWLIGDDFLRNAEDAASPTILDKQWEWYLSTFRTRLARDGRIIIIMTRWSDADIPGRLLAQANRDPNTDQWHHINLPALKESDPTELDPRKPGEALWPKFFPVAELNKIKASSSRTWQSLYQGDPVPPGGNIVQDTWWRHYRRSELPTRWGKVIMSCDLTFEGSHKGDWTVLQVWGKANGLAYLLAQVRRQIPFTKQVHAVRQLYDAARQRYPLGEVLVEKAANGAALVDTLRTKVPGIIAVPVGKANKTARAEAVTPLIEAGQVYLPHPDDTAWVKEYRQEWARFPHAPHDDVVDATSQALRRLFPPRAILGKSLPESITRTSYFANA